jgi:hypothetical protein
MQTHNSRLYRLKGPNIHALHRIEYSTDNLRRINNHKPLKPILETTLAYPYAHSYN